MKKNLYFTLDNYKMKVSLIKMLIVFFFSKYIYNKNLIKIYFIVNILHTSLTVTNTHVSNSLHIKIIKNNILTLSDFKI